MIGITGHRDLRAQDHDALQASLRSIFDDLLRTYPNTPLLIVSALAEGADRLAARVALEYGAELICPLPFAKELYVQDCSTPESRVEFDELLAQANYWFELPLMHHHTIEDIREHVPARDMQYAQCGAYLALRSQILIALWNGEHNKLVGGTSQVVRFKLQGVQEPYARAHSPLDVIDSGPVYQIVTPRQSQFNVPADAFSIKYHYPEGIDVAEESSSEFESIYRRIDQFNRDASEYEGNNPSSVAQSKAYLLPEHKQERLSPRGYAMLSLYAVADSLSVDFQRSTLRTLRVLLSAVFVAAAFFHFYTHLYYATPLFLGVYLVVFAGAYVWHYFASRKKFQAKYLDYRALAEGLRIQFFWQLAGYHDSVAFYYLRKQKSALDWVRHAIRSSLMSVLALQNLERRKEFIEEEHEFYEAEDAEHLAVVHEHWVVDQARYFQRSAHREHHRQEWYERWINGSLLVGFGLSVVQLFIPPNHYVWVVIGLTAIAAGMMHTYTDKRAFTQHSKQYQRMGGIFARASSHLRALLEGRKMDEAREFIGELGREALIENGDWIHTHRDRPIEVPKGA